MFSGSVCMVTGATSGIGKATSFALAAQGAELIVLGRDRQKAEDVVQRIQTETGNPAVRYMLADFAHLDQVRKLAADFKREYSRLDVLVNNAGAYFNRRHETPHGVEKTFLVNHLAPFLLTNLLLDVIRSSAPSRIINVSSDAHRQDKMNFDDLGFKGGYFGMRAYARSKLANVLFTYELAWRLAGSEVTVNAVHPGHVATDIWRTNLPFVGRLVKWIMGFIALSPEEGADTVVYLATSTEVAGLSGRYFVERQAVASSPVSYDEEVARRLWEVSANMVGLT